MKKGDSVNIDFKPKEKETSPPKHYTIETLNNYLKNPFREEKTRAAESDGEDDEEEYRAMFEGLGAGNRGDKNGIIDNARRSKYIELKKKMCIIFCRTVNILLNRLCVWIYQWINIKRHSSVRR